MEHALDGFLRLLRLEANEGFCITTTNFERQTTASMFRAEHKSTHCLQTSTMCSLYCYHRKYTIWIKEA